MLTSNQSQNVPLYSLQLFPVARHSENVRYLGLPDLRSCSQIYLSAKRAETRSCPICEESIPLRLLSHHLELELSRVEEIAQHIGSAFAHPDAILDSETG
jgi:hypothetical protein